MAHFGVGFSYDNVSLSLLLTKPLICSSLWTVRILTRRLNCVLYTEPLGIEFQTRYVLVVQLCFPFILFYIVIGLSLRCNSHVYLHASSTAAFQIRYDLTSGFYPLLLSFVHERKDHVVTAFKELDDVLSILCLSTGSAMLLKQTLAIGGSTDHGGVMTEFGVADTSVDVVKRLLNQRVDLLQKL